MKLRLQLPIVTIATLSLVSAIHTQGQVTTALPPSAPTAPPAVFPAETLSEMTTYLNLGPGTMANAVKILEDNYFEKYTKTAEEADLFPKLIYGPGTEDAPIAGELKLSLYNRRALDAVALVAAAAGCRLEPIPALPDSPEDKKQPQRVIGYYVTSAMRNTTAQGPGIKTGFMDVPIGAATGTIGLTLGEQNGDILIRDVVPGLPAAQSRAIVPGEKLLSIAEEGSTEVRVAEVGPEKVTELLVGEPGSKVRVTVAPPHGEGQPKAVLLTRQPVQGTLSLPHPPSVRVVEPVVDTFVYRALQPNPAVPGMAPGTSPVDGNVTDFAFTTPSAIPSVTSATPTPTGPLVRIYPVAFYVKGDEGDDLAKKQLGLQRLIEDALHLAKLDENDSPTLSLHGGTKVLIVKATATQHEIIQQIITSLKENEQAETKGGGPLSR